MTKTIDDIFKREIYPNVKNNIQELELAEIIYFAMFSGVEEQNSERVKQYIKYLEKNQVGFSQITSLEKKVRQKIFLKLEKYQDNILNFLDGKIKSIFLAYPGYGSEAVINGYYPYKNSKKHIPDIFFGGTMTASENIKATGVFFTPYNTFDFKKDKRKVYGLLDNLLDIKEKTSIQKIGIAGTLPGYLEKVVNLEDYGIVPGIWGTLSSILIGIEDKFDINKDVLVAGVGRIGEEMIKILKERGYNVYGFEQYKKEDERKEIEKKLGVKIFSKKEEIKDIKQIVNLLWKGDNLIKSLDKSWFGISLDDTYPPQTKILKNMFLSKVAAGFKDLKIVPFVPFFDADGLPGCAVEAIAKSNFEQVNDNFNDFYRILKENKFVYKGVDIKDRRAYFKILKSFI